jgi:hypothetical protein
MGAKEDFLAEVNEVFGFYFDVGMACHFALGLLEKHQAEIGNVDDAPFMYADGPPSGTPDEELKRSLHDSTLGGIKSRLKDGGMDQRKAAETAIVFVFHIWEEKYRGKVLDKSGQPKVNSDIMADLRYLRNSIIHNKGIAKTDVAKCKVFTRFKPGDQIILQKQDIYAIIKAIRGDFQS